MEALTKYSDIPEEGIGPAEPLFISEPLPEPDPLNTLVIFEVASGRIRGTIMGQSLDFALAHNCPDDCSIIESNAEEVSPYGFYVVDGDLVGRPTFNLVADKVSIAADGVDTITLLGFPAGSAISIEGPVADHWVEESAMVDLTVNVRGTYAVKVSNFPYQDRSVTFNAT